MLDGIYVYINKTLKKIEKVEVNTNNIGLNTETKEEFKEIINIALLGIREDKSACSYGGAEPVASGMQSHPQTPPGKIFGK